MNNILIHYIFISYIFNPILFSIGVYQIRDKNKVDENGKEVSFWKWFKYAFGWFFKENKLSYLFAPVFLPFEIYHIVKNFIKSIINNK